MPGARLTDDRVGPDGLTFIERARGDRPLEPPDAPHLAVVDAALFEFHRVVCAINVDHALGHPVAPAIALSIDPGKPRMALTIEDDLSPLELALLQELLGQNLDLRYRYNRLEIFCPSLEALDGFDGADREMPGERFRQHCR